MNDYCIGVIKKLTW